MLNIVDWNINPNQDWYVTLDDSGSNILVKLYNSQSDAEVGSNVVAEGSGAYGTGSHVDLIMDESGSPTISLFNSDLDYHIAVTGDAGDTQKIFHVAPFVDLDEISDGIYKSLSLIQAKALYEINLHTHITKERSINLAGLFQGILVDDVLQVQSDMMGIDVLTTVIGTAITGTVDSLITQVTTVEYIDMVYNG